MAAAAAAAAATSSTTFLCASTRSSLLKPRNSVFQKITTVQRLGFTMSSTSTSDSKKQPTAAVRQFAPLSSSRGQADGRLVLQGVVFDVDGTLCMPQNHMFSEMRAALGNIPKTVDILDHIYSLPTQAEQDAAHAKIQAVERAAMQEQVPQQGLVALMDYLDSRGIKKGICTRNFDTPVNHLLLNHLPGHNIHPIVTRDFRPPKPSPGGILHIAKAWDIVRDSDIVDHKPVAKVPIPLIMVGDSIDDMIAGHEAGAATVLLRSEGKEELEKDPRTDLVISRLDELIEILESGFEGRNTAE